MAKLRQPNPKTSPAANEFAGPQPLHGLEKVAWWSVPITGIVALACVSTLGFLYLNKPKATAPVNPVVAHSPGDSADSNFVPTTKVVETTPNLTASMEPKAAPQSVADDVEPENQKVVVEKPPTAEPVGSPSVSAKVLTSLNCEQNSILFDGQGKLKFVDKQPAISRPARNGVEFAHLFFNGKDQSVELPTVAKEQGSLLIVTKMPPRKTSIFLDSSFQRLTLRKNRDGLRWRIAGEQKPATIRNAGNEIDFNQWHHIVVTWKTGGDAILYVDGKEFDRYAYTNEQPHFPNYEDMVLGRTRGPGGRYYECRVHKFVVYDQAIPANEIAKLNQSIRETYPFIFN